MEANSGRVAVPTERTESPTGESAPHGFYNTTGKEQKAAAGCGGGDCNEVAPASTSTGAGDLSIDERKEVAQLQEENRYIIGRILRDAPTIGKTRYVAITWKGYPGEYVIKFGDLTKELRCKLN